MKLYSARGVLRAVAPFDFEQSLDFIETFRPMHGEQSLAPRSLNKMFSICGQPILVQVICPSSADPSALNYTLYAARPIQSEVQQAAEDRIRFFLSLDDDLSGFYAVGLQDRCFAAVIERLYGLHQVKFPTPFEIACWSVLTQRLPIAVSRKLKDALVQRYGAVLEVNGTSDTGGVCPWRYQAFPEPARLTASVDDLRALLKNERKAEYLSAVIRAFQDVDENWLRAGDYDDVRRWLLAIKGIGEWSADFILVRGLGRMNQLHVTRDSIFEERLGKAVARVYAPGRTVSGKDLLHLAEQYGEWQGYWALYLRTAAG